MVEFLEGRVEGNICLGGIYRKRITEADFTIDLLHDSRESINNKIRSQAMYKGAVVCVGDEKFYVDGIRDWSDAAHQHTHVRVDTDRIDVVRADAWFSLAITKK
jgi:methionyl-tRNA formyltransferase